MLGVLGVSINSYRYSDTHKDVIRLARKCGWKMRSRQSWLPKNARTRRSLRRFLEWKGEDHTWYYIAVPGHCLLVTNRGETVIDTAPDFTNRSKVLGIWAVVSPLR